MRTLLAVLVLAAPALADVVHLRNGGRIEGRVTEEGNRIRIETATGTLTVDRKDVVRIEKKPWDPPARPNVVPKAKPVRLGTSFSHPFHAFKIRLPHGWKRGRRSQGRATVSFWGPKTQGFQPRMDLFMETSDIELPDLIARYKSAFRKAFADVTYPFEATMTANGKTAYQFSATFSDGAPAIRQQSLWTFVVDDRRKAIMSFNCTAAWYGRYKPFVDASMRSIRLFDPPEITPDEKSRFLTRYAQARKAYEAGRLEDAREGFEEALRIVPSYVEIYTALGAIHMKTGRIADAESTYRRAMKLDPGDATHAYNLGVCLLKQDKIAQAITALESALKIDPASVSALVNLGVAFLSKDLNGPASKHLERAVLLDPENAAAHYNLGLAYERLDRPRDAAREYKEALSADSKHAEARKALKRVKSRK